jgi:L-ascorbate metabolism protein UlaG (beta-lactamase superfamily)
MKENPMHSASAKTRPAGRQVDLFAPRGTHPPAASALRLTALGNAGFLVDAGTKAVFLDPFIQASPDAQRLGEASVGEGSSILITHDHWDHLNVRAVTEAAGRGATILGPEPAIRALSRQVPKHALVQLEPDDIGACAVADIPGGRVTAFRSRHGQAHNSYLLELGGFRVFDDGDNEHTECLGRSALQDLDALILCPWQGSGWVDFIAGTRPRHWFLMHMTEEEFRAHDGGKFLPDLCDHVPMEAVALRPGESFDIAGRTAAP